MMWVLSFAFAAMAVLYAATGLEVSRELGIALLAYVAVLSAGIALAHRLVKVQRDLIERRSR